MRKLFAAPNPQILGEPNPNPNTPAMPQIPKSACKPGRSHRCLLYARNSHILSGVHQVSLKLTAVLCRCPLNTPLKMMKEDTIEIVGFHGHIYFNADNRDVAARVREGLTQFEVQLGRWHDKPIGPHPQAMYQVAFLPS